LDGAASAAGALAPPEFVDIPVNLLFGNVVTTPRCTLHLCANEATDHAVEAASEELIVFSLYFLQLPNNSELKQLLLGLFRQL
jgi:hypothetical protein